MWDLGLSILSSSLIFVVFKYFSVYRVQAQFGIIVNYMVASAVGILFQDGSISWQELPSRPWFPGTLLLGTLFIVVFNLMARSSQIMGVSVTSVATKMSLVIPVIVGVILYGEELGSLKIIGILLALTAVYFSSVRQNGFHPAGRELLLPFVVFLGSGVIDASIKYLEATKMTYGDFPLFASVVFASAAAAGSVIALLQAVRKPLKIRIRNIVGGVALGVPNFFSIYFILRALQHPSLNSSSVFTINNVAIVMLTTLLGMILFREKLSRLNWVGIGMAIVSILLVLFF